MSVIVCVYAHTIYIYIYVYRLYNLYTYLYIWYTHTNVYTCSIIDNWANWVSIGFRIVRKPYKFQVIRSWRTRKVSSSICREARTKWNCPKIQWYSDNLRYSFDWYCCDTILDFTRLFNFKSGHTRRLPWSVTVGVHAKWAASGKSSTNVEHCDDMARCSTSVQQGKKKGLTHYEFILTAFTCNAKRTQLGDAQLPTNQSFRNSMKWYKMNVVQGEGMKGMCCDMFWEVLNTSCMVPASGKSIFFRAISPAGLEQGFSGSRFQLWDCDILQDLATIWIPCLVLFAMAIRLESSAPSPDTDLHRSRAALRSFKSTV